jgi:hypothetical protein
MNQLTDVLEALAIGAPQSHANMKIYPLSVPNGHHRSYQTLDEALKAGTFTVSEVSEGGSVPTLQVHNTGSQPVLLVVGEELVGAKQNRVLNTSLLVAAQSDLQIPVSCVERSRWSYNSRSFGSGDTTSHMTLRREQTRNVTQNLYETGRFDANQSAVWQEVDRKMRSHGATSSTAALHDIYDQTQTKLDNFLNAFTPPDSEGMLIAINGRIVGADIFDHHDTLRSLFPKLLRGYALDALEKQVSDAAALEEDTQHFLDDTRNLDSQIFASAGLGQDVRLNSDDWIGSSLVWDNRSIHTSLFRS